jgi:hypothetical protein
VQQIISLELRGLVEMCPTGSLRAWLAPIQLARVTWDQ